MESSSANKEKQKEAKGVDSVTDFVEEKESNDVSKALAAVDKIGGNKVTSSSAIVVKEEDVKLIIDECEISREAAESLLKMNSGDLSLALVSFARGEFVLTKVSLNK